MDRNEFIEELENNGYSYEIQGDSIIVTHDGDVDINSAEIPERVTFKNSGNVGIRTAKNLKKDVVFENLGRVYANVVRKIGEGTIFGNGSYVHLDYLEEISGKCVFCNGGSVNIPFLKKIEKGTQFINGGYVALDSLEELSEDVVFYNGWYVYLRSLKCLPDGIRFNNYGRVYVNRLIGDYKYRGKIRSFEQDGTATVLVENEKIISGYTIKSVRYFGGGPIEELDKCYIAEKDGESAHGSTVREAIEDLQFKLMERTGTKELVEDIKGSGRVTLAQFRYITGACREGTRHHLAGLGIVLDDISDMDLDEALAAMEGTAFGETFKKALTDN